MTPAFGLVAHVAMMLNGFVQPVVRAHNAALAIVAIGEQTRPSRRSPIEERWPANGPAVFRKNVVRTEPFWNQQHYSKDRSEPCAKAGSMRRLSSLSVE